MFKHLLVPTDASSESFVAARLGARLVGPEGRLTLLHVSSDSELVALAGLDAASVAVAGVPAELVDHRRTEIESESASVVARTGEALAGLPLARVEGRTAHGRVATVLLSAIASEGVDGAVIGTRGRGLLARALLGSVSDAVVRGATRPVVVARAESVTRILAAVDGSAESLRAATAAASLAHALGVPFELVFAVEFPIDTYIEQRPALEQAFQKQAEAYFEAARAQSAVAPAATHVVFHEPAHAITTRAEHSGADLVVVGRRGAGLSAHPLGSVSLRVAMSAHASVLVVP